MKHLVEQQEVDNVVHMYFAHMEGRYFLEMLRAFAQGRGYGMETTCCVFAFEFQPEDEEYFADNGVQISRTFPNEEFVILSYNQFFEYLMEECKKYPDYSDEINLHLEEIRKRLNL